MPEGRIRGLQELWKRLGLPPANQKIEARTVNLRLHGGFFSSLLGEEPAADGDLLAILEPSVPDLITAWQVDKWVGNVRNDDAGLATSAPAGGNQSPRIMSEIKQSYRSDAS
jgi:hypothetical protein